MVRIKMRGVPIAWMTAATIGFAVAGAAFHFPGSYPVGSGGLGLQPSAAAVGGIMGAVSGAIAGALLWAVARRRATWWLIPATAAGFGVTHALGDGLPWTIPYALIGLVGGAAIGAAQSRALTPPPEPVSYTIGSALGLAAGVVVGIAAVEGLGLMAQPWTPALGAQQHAISSAVAGLLWSFSTGRRLVARA
jgi:hypothetical protein